MMLKFESDRERNILSVSFEGMARDIYKELAVAVVAVLDEMELESSDGAVPLSDSITTFGQHLIMAAKVAEEIKK